MSDFILEKAFNAARALKRAVEGPPRVPNLLGDRDVEWSWIAANMPSGPGRALDFGNGGGPLALMAALRGFDAWAVDLNPVNWPYVHSNLRFLQGNIHTLDLEKGSFDLISNCSVVEHIGVPGRYNVAVDDADGDLKAMARLRELMSHSGLMLLTVPVGEDEVFRPIARVYGEKRLPMLLASFQVAFESYFTKEPISKRLAFSC